MLIDLVEQRPVVGHACDRPAGPFADPRELPRRLLGPRILGPAGLDLGGIAHAVEDVLVVEALEAVVDRSEVEGVRRPVTPHLQS